MQWLQTHIDTPFQMSLLAEAVSVSERTLLRHFQQVLGRTPLDYLHELRAERGQSSARGYLAGRKVHRAGLWLPRRRVFPASVPACDRPHAVGITAAEHGARASGVVNAVPKQVVRNMHAHHFAQHQPVAGGGAGGGSQRHDLRNAAFEGHRGFRHARCPDHARGCRRHPARTNSSTSGGAGAQLRCIASANGRVAKFQPNSLVALILRSVSLRPRLEKPTIGGV